jgi:hypothetical protein
MGRRQLFLCGNGASAKVGVALRNALSNASSAVSAAVRCLDFARR